MCLFPLGKQKKKNPAIIRCYTFQFPELRTDETRGGFSANLDWLHGRGERRGGSEWLGETGSFIWTECLCSKSVCRLERRIKGFEQIIGAFRMCVVLTSCCQSLSATVQRISHPGAKLRWHTITRGKMLVPHVCLAGCCQRCRASSDQMVHLYFIYFFPLVFCQRKDFGLTCHFEEACEMRTCWNQTRRAGLEK